MAHSKIVLRGKAEFLLKIVEFVEANETHLKQEQKTRIEQGENVVTFRKNSADLLLTIIQAMKNTDTDEVVRISQYQGASTKK